MSIHAGHRAHIRSETEAEDYDFAFILYLTDINGEWKVTDMETAK